MTLAAWSTGWAWFNAPYAYLDRESRRRGQSFFIDLPVAGKCLVTGDPECIRQIAFNPALEGGRGVMGLRGVLGARSTIMLHGTEHAVRRRFLRPLFEEDQVQGFSAALALRVLEGVEGLPIGSPFSLYEHFRAIFLKTMAEFLFGPAESRGAEEERVRLINRFVTSLRNPFVLFFPALRQVPGLRGPWERMTRAREELRAYIESQIRPGPVQGCLGVLMGTATTPCPVDVLVEEIMALLLFGQDSAAASVAWAVCHLMRHPEAWKRLQEEERGSQNGHSPWLMACVDEALRLTPVVVHLTRVATSPTIVGPFSLAPGERALPCLYLAHRNPSVFQEPDRYDPARFLKGSFPYSFFPFGIGDRVCVGRLLALAQMRAALSAMARVGEWRLAPGYTPRPAREMVMVLPAQGGRVVRVA